MHFLATTDRSEELSLKDASASGDTATATLLGSPISDELKATVRDLAAPGKSLQNAAEELFAATSRMDAFASADLNVASQAMQASVALRASSPEVESAKRGFRRGGVGDSSDSGKPRRR